MDDRAAKEVAGRVAGRSVSPASRVQSWLRILGVDEIVVHISPSSLAYLRSRSQLTTPRRDPPDGRAEPARHHRLAELGKAGRVALPRGGASQGMRPVLLRGVQSWMYVGCLVA